MVIIGECGEQSIPAENYAFPYVLTYRSWYFYHAIRISVYTTGSKFPHGLVP